MEEKRDETEEELMNRLAKEILRKGNVKTVFEVEEKLKKSFGKVIESMLNAEMKEHLGHDKYEHTEESKE